MSFDLFFAGSQATECDELMVNRNLCRLGSQLSDSKLFQYFFDAREKGYTGKIFVDSGAYSAHTRGIEIDIDQYIHKIDGWGPYIDEFANLDIIPDKASPDGIRKSCYDGWNNFLHIQENSKFPEKCAFVIHKNDPQDIVDVAIDYYKQHPQLTMMALGGLVGEPSDAFAYCVKTCNRLKKELPYLKIHLFGYTRLKQLPHINCDSTDSTTWIMAGANGSILTPYGPVLVSNVKKYLPQHLNGLPEQARQIVLNQIERFGFTQEQLGDDYKSRMLFNIKFLEEWQKNYKYVPKNVSTHKKLF